VNGYEQQFRIGSRSLLALLIVQSDLFAYQSRATIATFDERLAKARLLAAIGQLAIAYQVTQISTEPNEASLPLAAPSTSATVSEPFGYKPKSNSVPIPP
jgi:hypothetical protein